MGGAARSRTPIVSTVEEVRTAARSPSWYAIRSRLRCRKRSPAATRPRRNSRPAPGRCWDTCWRQVALNGLYRGRQSTCRQIAAGAGKLAGSSRARYLPESIVSGLGRDGAGSAENAGYRAAARHSARLPCGSAGIPYQRLAIGGAVFATARLWMPVTVAAVRLPLKSPPAVGNWLEPIVPDI